MKIYPKILITLFTLFSLNAREIELPSVFSDHMVLQRDANVNIWGKGEPGETVEVRFAGQNPSTRGDSEGRWALQLAALGVSAEPRSMVVISGESEITFNDVLVGDVWLCSGQSNMAWYLRDTIQGDFEIAGARNPLIRLFQVDRVTVQEPRFSASKTWLPCNSETVDGFSAIGYYFGKDLQQVIDIPIGLIDSSWGGTAIVAWTREETLRSSPHTAAKVTQWKQQLANFDEFHAQWEKDIEAYANEHDIIVTNVDQGISEEAMRYSEKDFDDSSWEQMELPDIIENSIGNIDGSVWFRLKVELPEAFRNRPLTLRLGAIDDLDITFVNGVEIGSHMRSEDKPYAIPRVYPIPAELTTSDSLTIAVRLFDEVGEGGFTGSSGSMLLENEDGNEIPIAGEWRYKTESPLKPAVGSWNVKGPVEPEGSSSPNRPGILANSMLTPVSPYTLKGSIWYQGEQDVDWDPNLYEERLYLLLSDWRARWGQPDLAMGIVQLANFQLPADGPTDSDWARIRDSQLRFSQKDARVGLAVTIDIGETNDIHPRNKEDVGHRLSRWALTDIYGILDLSGGPIVHSCQIKDGAIEITFSNIGKGLKAMNGEPLSEFTLAGKDRTFFSAEATIIGKNKVLVRSEMVSDPVAVRYAWADNPIHANLVNDKRLPASPFRTDDWAE